MAVSFASNVLVTAADMAANFNSDSVFLAKKDGYAVHAIFTGSPLGSFYIAVSIDGVNFTVLTDSTNAIAAAGDILICVEAEPLKTSAVTLYGYKPNCKKSPALNTKSLEDTEGKLPTVIVVELAAGTEARVKAFAWTVVKLPW